MTKDTQEVHTGTQRQGVRVKLSNPLLESH